jgi:50S ribosomal protein L16 3-hydroxylase
VSLYVDGEGFECADEMAPFAELLCAQDSITADTSVLTSERALAMIAKLFNQGSLAFALED